MPSKMFLEIEVVNWRKDEHCSTKHNKEN